jgi:small subunit ribosomal protein S3
MGHKVNPRAFRHATTYKVPSRWFASRQTFARNLQTDVEIRDLVRRKFRDAGIARVEIERSVGEITLNIHTAKPGVVIGRGGAQIEEFKKELKRTFFGSEKMKVSVNIHEVRDPDMTAELIYQSIRDQIEQRVPFRRAIKRAQEQVMRAGAKGCRIMVSGRLNGSEIARTEAVSQGQLPLHTLRANIDYSRGVANTVYGVIGIKVWVYKGEVFGEEEPVEEKKPRKPMRREGGRRKRLATAPGKGTILRKKSDVEKEKSEKAAAKQAPLVEETATEAAE